MTFLALALLLQVASSEEAEDLRQRALTLYAEADSAGATAALEASLDGPWTSAEALLTLGRLHLARGEPGLAVLALERAARLAPRDREIAASRREAYALTGQVAPRVAAPFVASRSVAARVGAGALVVLALLLYLGAMTLAFVWWRGRDRRVGWAGLAVAPVAVAALALAGLALWDAGTDRAVALATVEVRARPTPEAPAVERMREGETVRLGDAASGWRRVDAGGAEGWVPERAVAPLTP